MEQKQYQAYLELLRRELVPAMGCTEPIAIAYAGALARKALGALPDKAELCVSGNIIKNVKSVIVPHTGGRKGLCTALCAGMLFGDPEKELEVLSDVTDAQLAGLDEYLQEIDFRLSQSAAPNPFDIQLTVRARGEEAYVRIISTHTNVVELRGRGQVYIQKEYSEEPAPVQQDDDIDLTIAGVVEFADTVDLADVEQTLQRQLDFNIAIAKQGLTGRYGAGIGKILLSSYGDTVQNRAKAWAAAGSDARMNGCELPVVINSGSGNQGLTASLPVWVYAEHLGVTREKLLRALVVSNLVTIRLKKGIGSLSAYCGATSAGAGAGAGIAYLYGGGYSQVAHTVVNALAINSGLICDGAKSSCAAKIASSVEAGLLGMQMNLHDSEFVGGDGIVITGVENTIDAVSLLARDGMRQTEDEILDLMLNGPCGRK